MTDAAREAAHGAPDGEVLDLQPGEFVRVKSREEILRTLDEGGRHRGLTFMPEMFDLCGRRFRVQKRVRKMLMEDTAEMRRARNTVLLEGTRCGGAGIGCDRACSILWHEKWLRRENDQRPHHD